MHADGDEGCVAETDWCTQDCSQGLMAGLVGRLVVVVGPGVESTCGPKISLPTRAHPDPFENQALYLLPNK